MLDDLEELERRRLSRSYLLPFVEYTYPGRWVSGRHHAEVCEALEAVERGEIKRLMISMPPRSSKSELVSRRFPAWCMGRHPDWQMIAASHTAQLANDMSSDVMRIIREPEYRRLFKTELDAKAQAADRWYTTAGGVYVSAGVGGSIAGRGANCLAAGTRILTTSGQIPIEDIRPGHWVLTHMGRWRPVIAVSCNGMQPVMKLSGHGVNVVCTNEHRFLTERGWHAAEECEAIRGLGVRTMRAIICPEGAMEKTEILQPGMQQGEHQAKIVSWKTELRRMRAKNPAPKIGEMALLLVKMLWGIFQKNRDVAHVVPETMRALRTAISAKIFRAEVLHGVMQRQFAQRFDARGEQPKPQAWERCREACAEGERESIPRNDPKFRRMRGVRGENGPAGSPYQRESEGQRESKPCCSLPWLSFKISHVERCGIARVYDIQVGEDHSFIANGLVSHNCLIIDDPVRGRNEAESPRMREVAWRWYLGDAFQRLMPGGAIVFCMTRWHQDDLAGRILDADPDGAWTQIVMPAIANEHSEHEEALWPEMWPLEEMRSKRATFTHGGRVREWLAQYQQQPTVEEGDYFKRSWVHRYEPEELPRHLKVYMGSDFAVTEAREGSDPDFTEHAVIGICPAGDVWAIDWWSGQTTPDVWVESRLDLIVKHKPRAVFGEGGVIRRAVEPFLKRRKRERRISSRDEWLNPVKDKATRGRAFQAMASSGRIHFPAGVEWADRAVEQFTGFPMLKHDDAFDAMSLLCLAIDEAHPAIVREERQEKRDAWDFDDSAKPSSWRVV